MLVTEYRIPMPFSVDEYQIGQLFMISRHSHEQSESGEGVEVVHNVPHMDDEHGAGRYTEKRIHLSSKLPYFIQSFIPKVFYVTEKSWNYYPYTETEYTCSFLPRFSIFIKTRYENNNGTTENCLELKDDELVNRIIDFVDIAEDEVQTKHYKASEDPKLYKSIKANRGPLLDGWRETSQPIMCSYKLVSCTFEIWGLQTRVEDFAQKAIREILLLGHRQAFAWLDDWYGMTEEDVRNYEVKMQAETNEKVLGTGTVTQTLTEDPAEDEAQNASENEKTYGSARSTEAQAEKSSSGGTPTGGRGTTPAPLHGGPVAGIKSWFAWN